MRPFYSGGTVLRRCRSLIYISEDANYYFSPGRFQAAGAIKMVIVHVITNYDIRLEDPDARKTWRFESFTLPYASTKVVIRKRTWSSCELRERET